MKKILLIMALLVTVPFYAQKRVAAKIQELNNSGVSFKNFSPLTVTEGSKDYDIVDNETYATINNNILETIYKTKPETIALTIPYQGNDITINLYKVNIFANGFHMDTDKEKDYAYKHGVYYRGIIKNDNNSLASFSFFEKEMSGIISNQEHKNIVVGKLAKRNNFSEYIIYSDNELNVDNPFICSSADEIDEEIKAQKFGKKSALSQQSTETLKCVGIYYEVDYDMFIENLGSEDVTANWLTTLFNNIQTLYYNDGIDISLKSFFIWTTPDPYSGVDSEDYLYDFLEHSQSNPFDGDLGQLLAEDEGGLGGLAPLNGVCSAPYNGSYVDVNDAYLQEVPLYSWSVQASAHEIGHQLGSPHTHACAWNGNNTAIDGCYDVEGSCSTPPIPSNGGTIMSYCHLTNVQINLANGFGEQPAQLIRDVVNNSGCLASECESGLCDTTIIDLGIVDNSIENFSIEWSDSGETNAWEVTVGPVNTPSEGTWTEVNTPNVNITGLEPNTYYTFKVRNVCEQGTSQIQEIMFVTDADWCTGYYYMDTNIDGQNYSNNQNITRTFTPSEENKIIKVEFVSFSLENGYDYLTVYDGADTSAPLIGNFTGAFITNEFTSTAEDGSLTFVFSSDDTETDEGWVAYVECVDAPANRLNENSFSNFSYYPNPTNSVINISAGEEITEVKVYAVSGQLLFTRKVNATQAAIDISALANGVYFFKATNNIKETNFRVVKQ
ncbi:M12 family metallo-peptidase [Flavobacterium suaedae]|nr:M12 family metallo-peptidase [Flavobacterium suaedae]